MSSRALRKLKKEKGIEGVVKVSACDHDPKVELELEGTTESENCQRQRPNIFSLLAEEEDKSAESDCNESDQAPKMAKSRPSDESQGIDRSVKKKKKKKKRKQNKAEEKAEEKAELQNKENVNEAEDEIDKSIREVNEILGVSSHITTATAVEVTAVELESRAILGIEHRNLNADNEMRRRFGSNVVQGERRRNPHGRTHRRPTWLVTPRPNWGPVGKIGLDMKLLEVKNGYNYFSFEHLAAYQKLQFQFLDAVESLDHNNIVALVNAHPYHIDSLLQLSEVCKISEDYQMAAELNERALYVFENSFHTLFNVTQSNCRLDYRKAENRPFFLALFRHLNYIGQRSCYRTSLEFCKLLLGLDPDDPLATLLMIDFYALRSEQYDYLIRLYQEWEATKNVSRLPSFCYSVALAMFHSGKFNNDQADLQLQEALLKFPSVLLLLMDKCGVSLDDQLINTPYFDRTVELSQSAGLNQLIALYVGRNHCLWKEPEVLNWLTRNIKAVVDQLESKIKFIEEWNEKRKTLYQRPPLNIYRHIIISDIKEATRGFPLDISTRSILTHDPLPPSDSFADYQRPERQTPQQQAGGLMSLFFRSMMPTYGMEGQGDERRPQVGGRAGRDDEPQGAQGMDEDSRTDLARSAQRVMEAMRALLDTMTYRGDLEGQEDNDDNNGDNRNEWDDNGERQ